MPGDSETYELVVDAHGVSITSDADWGGLHALATLTQLVTDAGIPTCRIADGPRFGWRGVMVDVARHFIAVDVLKRTLDAMALTKLNVLHLHLTDDQGFRFPSRRFPRLGDTGAQYTHDDLADLIDYAADRGVRVVPELNLPGHCTALLVAYPEWGVWPVEPTQRFGVHPGCLNISNPAVLNAVGELLDEVVDVFPDPYIHIGGDELHPKWWADTDGMQAFMARQGLPDVAAAQAWFTRFTVDRLAGRGRRAVAWDEVLSGSADGVAGAGGSDTPRPAVQAWRGATMRDNALLSGHDCIYSSGYYVDLMYPADAHYRIDPEAAEATLLQQEDALIERPEFAHVADGMRWTHAWRKPQHLPRARDPGRVLGAEACLWSELVDGDVLDQRLWGRMPALAERFWSSASVADADDMYERLARFRSRLEALVGMTLDLDYLLGRFDLSESWRGRAGAAGAGEMVRASARSGRARSATSRHGNAAGASIPDIHAARPRHRFSAGGIRYESTRSGAAVGFGDFRRRPVRAARLLDRMAAAGRLERNRARG